VLGYVGVPRNEVVDVEAKEAVVEAAIIRALPGVAATLAYIRRRIKEGAIEAF
jgi:hypothetical protein